MSLTKKTLTDAVMVVIGGMAVMVVTTVCGAMIGYNLYVDVPGYMPGIFEGVFGGAIGAVVGGLLWGLLGYMVYRKKNAPPNEIIPDDTTT
jgi:hypothetical protein